MSETFLSRQDQQKAVEHLDKTLAKWIQWVAAVLLTFFGYLEFRNAPLDKITEAFQATSITKLGLFIFFAGWALGATHDTRIQTEAYALDPDGGKIGSREFVGIALFLIVFTSLFLLHEQLIWFQACVLALICLNMWTYSVVVMGRAKTIIERSAMHYEKEKDYSRYLKLYCAVEYLLGSWQRRRFIWLFCLALTQLGVAIYLTYFGMPAAAAQLAIGGVKVSELAGYIPSGMFVIYVVVSEAWMKIYRFKIFADYETIDEIYEHFRVQRQPGTDLPVLNLDNLFKREVSQHTSYR